MIASRFDFRRGQIDRTGAGVRGRSGAKGRRSVEGIGRVRREDARSATGVALEMERWAGLPPESCANIPSLTRVSEDGGAESGALTLLVTAFRKCYRPARFRRMRGAAGGRRRIGDPGIRTQTWDHPVLSEAPELAIAGHSVVDPENRCHLSIRVRGDRPGAP
jgi:hypothetical protein